MPFSSLEARIRSAATSSFFARLRYCYSYVRMHVAWTNLIGLCESDHWAGEPSTCWADEMGRARRDRWRGQCGWPHGKSVCVCVRACLLQIETTCYRDKLVSTESRMDAKWQLFFQVVIMKMCICMSVRANSSRSTRTHTHTVMMASNHSKSYFYHSAKHCLPMTSTCVCAWMCIYVTGSYVPFYLFLYTHTQRIHFPSTNISNIPRANVCVCEMATTNAILNCVPLWHRKHTCHSCHLPTTLSLSVIDLFYEFVMQSVRPPPRCVRVAGRVSISPRPTPFYLSAIMPPPHLGHTYYSHTN